MRALRSQFFLTYALLSCVGVYIPMLLDEKLGDGEGQTVKGWILAINGVAIILAPILMAALADAKWRARTLLSCSFAVVGAGSLMLGGLGLGWLPNLLALWGLAYIFYTFAVRPQGTLQDGMYFTEAEKIKAAGQPAPPYSSVRIFGSLGYLLPLLVLGGLAAWLGAEGRHLPSAIPMLAGAGVAVLAVMNTLALPPSEMPAREGKGLPTTEAAAQLSLHKAWPFVIGMGLVQAGTASYFSYQPKLLTDVYRLREDWVSWVPALDVVLELLPMAFAPWMIGRFGARRVLLTAVFLQVARYVVFALAPDLVPACAAWLGVEAQSVLGRAPLWAAILTKGLVHGPIIVGIYVVPPILLNRMATPSCRNSVQALYTMLAVGVGILVGNAALGYVADRLGYQAVFLVAAECMLAGGMLLFVSSWGSEKPIASPEREEALASPSGSSAGTDD